MTARRQRNSPLLSCIAFILYTTEIQAANAAYSIDLTGITSGTAYTLTVNIGTLDTSGSTNKSNAFRMIADTGSSNDAVLGEGCCGPDAEVTYSCDASSTCVNGGGEKVTLAFAGANIQGQFMTDTWSSEQLGEISKTFMVIERQDTFYRSSYDGITGLAYETLVASTDMIVPSLYNVLIDTAKVTDAFGMLLCGTMQPLLQTGGTDFTLHSGQLLIGGTEGTHGENYYSGSMLYTPITREAWYVVMVTDIGYDGTSLGLSCDNYNDPQAILDSGTSNLAFPPDVYNALMNQIMTATLAAIPDFDPTYFDDSSSCCHESYCDPTSSSAALLQLPSIYFTLGLSSSDGSTKKHFTVEIPPEYYWRPEMNGANSSTPCRALGISEGSSTVLGDVFMDGLYSYHDRANGNIGLAVASNCPNNITSSKKVYPSDLSGDWCSCFSKSLQKSSRWTTYVPWGTGCFFWLWWMYLVLASIAVVIACICVLIWWHMTSKRMKKLQDGVNLSNTSGHRTTRFPTMQSSEAALAPASPPADYYVASTSTPKSGPNRSGRSGSRPGSIRSPRSQGRRSAPIEKEVPIMAQSKCSNMSSPRSPMSSTSSIALLSEAPSSMDSWKHNLKPLTSSSQNSDYKSSLNTRWGASIKENEF
ncbi:hypothetical protein F443_20834 [Plasmopara halstedii]|uniref:Peptidase A1 domain-containing protein n=1 Tax=Plasmopara halstedii TaxID=4781 RepID=A0A0P1B3R5_PLAHL|nr:hypothetical protein F443_20834 [Plasmopara halstedii]CEG48304.1 hypothetical protein F443_20834 [Plasmopara halstedii]|eukprot:XP_024584673.1 hypothetical protein F443_20834 [Plasmopara halstedii]